MLGRNLVRGGFALLLLAFAACETAPPAAVVAPDTIAGRKLDAWLNAFNSGDITQLDRFVRSELPDPESHGAIIASMGELRQRNGGYNLVEVTSRSDTMLEAQLEERTGGAEARMVVIVDASGRLADFRVTSQ